VSAQTRGFLFSDLRAYSAYVERHGDRAARELLARYRRTVRHAISQFGGAEIRTEGDSFYVVFGSVSQAVEAGLAIQAGLAASEGEPLRAGIGIHAGEVEDDAEEGIVSSAVNIAARICSVAEPGEVLVSEVVRGLTRTYLDVRFVPRGRRKLKGIRDSISVYRVLRPDQVGAAGLMPRWAAARTRPGTVPMLALMTVLVAFSAILGGALLRESLARNTTPPASSNAPAGGPMTEVDPTSSGAPSSGSELAVVRGSEAGTTDIYLVQSQSDPGTQLTADQGCYSPMWSPDGLSLAFICQSAPTLTSDFGSTEAYVVEVGTGLSEPLPMTGFGQGPVVATDVAWEPDGTLVVASGPDPIASGGICPPGECGLSFHDPSTVEAAMVGEVLEVAVSPATGELIFVGVDSETGERRLYAYSRSGEPRPLTLDSSDGIPGPLAWSPDGARVAITLESPSDGNADLYLYDVASASLAPLVTGSAWESHPSWSPDGEWVAFSSDRDGSSQIWAVEVDGDAEPVQRTQGPHDSLQAAWRPAP